MSRPAVMVTPAMAQQLAVHDLELSTVRLSDGTSRPGNKRGCFWDNVRYRSRCQALPVAGYGVGCAALELTTGRLSIAGGNLPASLPAIHRIRGSDGSYRWS